MCLDAFHVNDNVVITVRGCASLYACFIGVFYTYYFLPFRAGFCLDLWGTWKLYVRYPNLKE